MPQDMNLDLTRCPQCSMRFVRPEGLASHLAERHPDIVPSLPVYAEPHVPGQPEKIEEPPPDFVCDRCGATAKNLAGLKAHIRIKHAPTPSENPPPAA